VIETTAEIKEGASEQLEEVKKAAKETTGSQ
jgi:hypothetical protein